jgi:hypothetical protein
MLVIIQLKDCYHHICLPGHKPVFAVGRFGCEMSFVTLRKLIKLHGLSPQANYTDRLSDRRLSTKLVPTLADRGCRVVSATIPPPQSLI